MPRDAGTNEVSAAPTEAVTLQEPRPNSQTEPSQTEKKTPRTLHISGTLLVLLGCAIYFFLTFKTVIVSGHSMDPTFHDGQRLLACKAYWLVGPIQDNDIVVIKYGKKPGDYIIKRVYKNAGETVDWPNVPSNYQLTRGEYKVPEGDIYVLGDNRDVSEDSRSFGPVSKDQVIGKIIRLNP